MESDVTVSEQFLFVSWMIFMRTAKYDHFLISETLMKYSSQNI